MPYSAALGGLGGASVGASPMGGSIGMALAGGGTSLVANEGKAGGWELSRKFTALFCCENRHVNECFLFVNRFSNLY